MNCQQLAERISAFDSDLSDSEVARLCFMILSQVEASSLTDDQSLLDAWKHVSFRYDAALDQHAAVTDELERICVEEPVRFSHDQVWTLLRTIKIQSQILDLYTRRPVSID